MREEDVVANVAKTAAELALAIESVDTNLYTTSHRIST
jgi:hypothetical protein